MQSCSNDLSFLLKEKNQAYDELKEEYQEMKDLNAQIEKELEAEVEQLTQEKNRILEQNDKAHRQIIELKQKHSKETCSYEKALDRMESENVNLREELKAKSRIIIKSEIEIEQLESQLRESQSIIGDLESRIDLTYERLAIIHTQLEETKLQNEEEVQRLKERLKESQNEVIAYQAREASNANRSSRVGETAMATESQNIYFNAFMQHYDAYQANGGDDPSPHKKLRLELGKRSYQYLSYEANPEKTQFAQKIKQPLGARSKNRRSTKETVGILGNSVNLSQGGKVKAYQGDNSFQNDLYNLNSLNMMNQGFSKSLSMVTDLIEELDKQPAINHSFNTSYNFSLNNQSNNNMKMFSTNDENMRALSQNLNTGSNFNNISSIFSNNGNLSTNSLF